MSMGIAQFSVYVSSTMSCKVLVVELFVRAAVMPYAYVTFEVDGAVRKVGLACLAQHDATIM